MGKSVNKCNNVICLQFNRLHDCIVTGRIRYDVGCYEYLADGGSVVPRAEAIWNRSSYRLLRDRGGQRFQMVNNGFASGHRGRRNLRAPFLFCMV